MMDSLSTTLKIRKLLWAAILTAAVFPLSLLHAQDSSRVQRVLLYDCCGSSYGNHKGLLKSVLSDLSVEREFELVIAQNQSFFNYVSLKTVDVVVFAYMVQSEITSEQGRTDFERYVREGGGVVSIFEMSGSYDFPFLRDSVLIQHIGGSQSGIRSAIVYFDSQASENPEHAQILQNLTDSLTLEFITAPFSDRLNSGPRDRLDSAGATILLSTNFPPQGHYPLEAYSNYPVVWTREVGNGRAAVNMLGHPSSVYAQQDGYLQKLLWNLMEYVAGGEPVSVQPPGQALQAFPRFRLVGRSLALSLAGEGPHVLKVWNTRGELVQERTFRGAGEFHTLLRVQGVLLLRVEGPHGTLQQRIVVE